MILGYGGGAIADYPWHLDGTLPWSGLDTQKAMECLESLSRLGINIIDTANRYGGGRSEQIIGNFLIGSGYLGTVMTKIELSDHQKMFDDLSESVARLKRDRLAVLLHNPDLGNQDALNRGLDWLWEVLKWKEVAHVGISTEPSRALAPIYAEREYLSAIEFPFSCFDTRASYEMEFLYEMPQVTKIANRILGGPSKKKDIRASVDFIKGNCGLIDVALIGTINIKHLTEIKRMFDVY